MSSVSDISSTPAYQSVQANNQSKPLQPPSPPVQQTQPSTGADGDGDNDNSRSGTQFTGVA